MNRMKKETSPIELLVSSPVIKLNKISGFEVGVKLTNAGEDPVHFDMTQTALFVNSKRSIAWDLAVQNGTIINLKIPPGKSKSVQWPLGNALFEQTGIYKLELRWKEISLKQDVTVLE